MQNAKGDDIKKAQISKPLIFLYYIPRTMTVKAMPVPNYTHIHTHTYTYTHIKKQIKKMHKLGKKDKVVIFVLNERINKMVFAYAILGNGTKMALEYCLVFRGKLFN